MSKFYKVAVVGIGNMGFHHCRLLSTMANIKVEALCDLNLETKEKASEYLQVPFFSDPKALLQSFPDLDAVHICTPIKSHFEISKLFLEKGISVFVEKPLTHSFESGQKLLQIASENNAQLFCGYVERFNPVIQFLKSFLSEEKLGRITSIFIRRVGLTPSPDPEADIVSDLMVHDLDILNYLFEELPSHYFCRGDQVGKIERLDFCEVFLGYKDFNAVIQCNWITPIKIRKINLTGTKGYLEVDCLQQKAFFYEQYPVSNFRSFEDYVMKQQRAKPEAIYILPKEPLSEEIKYFYRVVGGEKNTICPIEQSLSVLKVVNNLENKMLKMAD